MKGKGYFFAVGLAKAVISSGGAKPGWTDGGRKRDGEITTLQREKEGEGRGLYFDFLCGGFWEKTVPRLIRFFEMF